MEPTATVLQFPRKDEPLAKRGIVLLSPGPGSRSTYLRALYGIAIGETELAADPDGRLALTFETPRAERVVALNGRVAQPPLGFALAVPVATRQELANALVVNQVDGYVHETLNRKCGWALLVAVHAPVRRIGIGRALANRALAAIRDAGGERVYLAVRGSDAWTTPWLLGRAFSRDGVTRETHPRTLFSCDVNFSF